VGLPKEYFDEGLDPEVSEAVRACADAAKKLGAEIVDVSLPHTRYALSAYYIIAPSEASSNLARFDGIRYGLRKGDANGGLADLYEASRGAGFGSEVKRRIMLGTYALSSGYYDAFYIKAQKVRTLIKKDFEEAYSKADVLLTPTTPTAAFKFGDKKDPLQMYLSDIYTIPCNIAGHGGLSMPCGKTKAGLPIGVQWMCRPGEESTMLQAARALEEALPAMELPEVPA
jgi:aspartyl-tRNA(Asn)/glutamyl-tRNA(Gln) amidotransferase subunit A